MATLCVGGGQGVAGTVEKIAQTKVIEGNLIVIDGGISLKYDLIIKDCLVVEPKEQDECYAIFAGKKATADGSVLAAHNNDLKGDEASKIERFPHMKHSPDETIKFPTGLVIPEVPETYAWMVQKIYSGFATGDAIAINEFGVSIAGGDSMHNDPNAKAKEVAPVVEQGLTGGVRYVALQRAKTARECVEILGALYTEYGVSYLSGVGVADADEVWYIETLGGRQWVAVRVPDDKYIAVANAYRIQEVDVNDTENVLTSPNLMEFCHETGLWDSTEGPLNFAKAFGGGKVNPNPYYDSRRVWEGQRLLTPSLDQDPDNKVNPMFLKPDKKLTVASLTNVLRSHYAGTKYDVYPEEGNGSMERAIAMPRTIHFSVVQIKSGMPAEIGCVLWSGLGSPLTTPLIPQYFGATDTHEAYKIADSICDDKSAWWTFNNITLIAAPYYKHLEQDIMPVWKEYEADVYAMQESVERQALELYQNDKTQACEYLTGYSMSRSCEALDKAKTMFNYLRTKLSANRNNLRGDY